MANSNNWLEQDDLYDKWTTSRKVKNGSGYEVSYRGLYKIWVGNNTMDVVVKGRTLWRYYGDIRQRNLYVYQPSMDHDVRWLNKYSGFKVRWGKLTPELQIHGEWESFEDQEGGSYVFYVDNESFLKRNRLVDPRYDQLAEYLASLVEDSVGQNYIFSIPGHPDKAVKVTMTSDDHWMITNGWDKKLKESLVISWQVVLCTYGNLTDYENLSHTELISLLDSVRAQVLSWLKRQRIFRILGSAEVRRIKFLSNVKYTPTSDLKHLTYYYNVRYEIPNVEMKSLFYLLEDGE